MTEDHASSPGTTSEISGEPLTARAAGGSAPLLEQQRRAAELISSSIILRWLAIGLGIILLGVAPRFGLADLSGRVIVYAAGSAVMANMIAMWAARRWRQRVAALNGLMLFDILLVSAAVRHIAGERTRGALGQRGAHRTVLSSRHPVYVGSKSSYRRSLRGHCGRGVHRRSDLARISYRDPPSRDRRASQVSLRGSDRIFRGGRCIEAEMGQSHEPPPYGQGLDGASGKRISEGEGRGAALG